MILFLKRPFIILFISVLTLLTGFSATVNTTGIGTGNWNNGPSWSSGSQPANGDIVNVNHPMTINVGISPSSGSVYTFYANSSGTGNINLSSGSTLDIRANVTFNGSGNNLNGGTIYVRSGYTLTIGSAINDAGTLIIIEEGATFNVTGTFTNNGGAIEVNGLLAITGDYDGQNSSAVVTGTGDITTTGHLVGINSSTIFGVVNPNCSGPCSGRNLCGRIASSSPSSALYCGTPVTLTASVSSGSPSSYQWQSSSTNTEAGFANIGGATSATFAASPASTTYYRVKITVGGCISTSKMSAITVAAGTISYAGSPYCSNLSSNPQVTRVGRVGGTYTSSPAGLTINSSTGTITPSTSSAGSYTVTYTIPAANGCSAVSTTASVTITSAPTVSAGTDITTCILNGAVNITPGATASNYTSISWTTSGSGTLANSTSLTAATYAYGFLEVGTKTLTLTAVGGSGCANATSTKNITINALPSGTFSYTGSPFCSNGTNPSPSVGGSFSSTAGLVFVSSSTGQINLAASTPGTYTITNSGACALVNTASVTITALPVATFSYTASPFCANAANPSPTYSGGGSAGTFSSTAGLNFVSTATGQVNIATSTAATYTVTNTKAAAAGCPVVAATSNITINAMPVVAAITGTTTVCAGSTVTLANATPGGVWSSATPAKATIDAAGVVTGVAAGSSVISYTITTNGCSTAVTTTVTVNALPAVAAITGASAVCAGSAITLSDATAGGSWSSGTPAVATVNTSGSVTGVAAGSTIISYSLTTTGCTTTQTKTITVNAMPVVAAITGNTPVCIGSAITLSDVTASGTWSSATPANATVNASGVVTGVAAGTSVISYSVTTSGCTTASTTTVTVNALPAVAAITGTLSVCKGLTTQLADGTAGGVWSSSNTARLTVDGTGLVTGVNTGGAPFISYTLTDVNGCVNAATAAVVVNAFPAVTAITGTSPMCEGAVNTYSNTTAGGVWSSSLPGFATINASTGDITGIAAGTSVISYAVTTSGCTTTKTKNIVVNAPVAQTISGSTALCVGNTTTYTVTTSGGTWSSGTPANASVNAASGAVTGVAAGTSLISYSVTTTGGCVNTTSQTITVSAPVAQTISGSNALCIGNSVTYNSTTSGGTWSSGTPANASVNAASGAVTGVAAGTSLISYSVTTTGGCVNTTSQTITVSAPVAQTISGSNALCIGNSVTYNSTTSGGTWSSGTPANASVNPATGLVTGIAAGTSLISYSVTTTGGCVNTASQTITVSAPVAQIISGSTPLCAIAFATYTSTTSGGTWSSGTPSVAIVNSGTGIVTGVSGGTSVISYSVVTAGGCVNTDTKTVTITICPNTWIGVTSTAWTNLSNWSLPALPTLSDEVVIPSGVPFMPVISSNVTVAKITVNSGATLTLASGGILNSAGDVVSDGTFTGNSGSQLHLQGSAAQTVSGTSPVSVYGLKIDNTTGVTINTPVTVNGTVNLTKGVVTSNNNLTLNFDNGGNIAYLVSDLGSITGNVAGQRFFIHGNHYISAPLAGMVVSQIASSTPISSYLYTRNFSNQGWNSVTSGSTTMDLGKGFSLGVNIAVPVTLSGTYNHALSVTGSTYYNGASGKYFLVGNPYPSTLDWDNSSGWTKTNISGAIYFWDAATKSIKTYLNGGGTNNATQYIPAMQSFLVMTNGSGGLSSVSLNPQCRVISNTAFYRASDDMKLMLEIHSETGQIDQTLIRFSEMTSASYEQETDAVKMMNPSSVPSLYTSIPSENIHTAINSQPMITPGMEIPLNLKVVLDGTYTLKCSKNEAAGYQLIVEDKVTGIQTAVDTSMKYTVNALSIDSANRFILKLVSITTDAQQTNAGGSGWQIYSSPNGFTVRAENNYTGNSTIEITDALGRTIKVLTNQTLQPGNNFLTLDDVAAGMYLIRVIHSKGSYTKQITITK